MVYRDVCKLLRKGAFCAATAALDCIIINASPRFLCRLTAPTKLPAAAQRQRAPYTETIEFASPANFALVRIQFY
jgi:hypothetical protein